MKKPLVLLAVSLASLALASPPPKAAAQPQPKPSAAQAQGQAANETLDRVEDRVCRTDKDCTIISNVCPHTYEAIHVLDATEAEAKNHAMAATVDCAPNGNAPPKPAAACEKGHCGFAPSKLAKTAGYVCAVEYQNLERTLQFARQCTKDADCSDESFGWNFGCFRPVAKGELKTLRAALATYQAACPNTVKELRCVEKPRATYCRNNFCEERPNPNAE